MNDPKISIRARIDHNFTYHPPFGDQKNRYELIRDTMKAASHCIANNTPVSREQSLALTALEEAVMWANAAIARNEKHPG